MGKKVKHVKTQLLSLAQLKHNKELRGQVDFAVMVTTALALYNHRPRKLLTQTAYIKFLAEQSGLKATFVKHHLYDMIRRGEAKWSEKKGYKNYIKFTKQMLQPTKVVRAKAIAYKEERYEKLNLKKGYGYKKDSDMDMYVMLSDKFYEFMEKYGLTLRQTILMVVLYHKRELTENSKMSIIGLADILCVSEPVMAKELKNLEKKGLLDITSGQKNREMNRMCILPEIKEEIKSAIEKGSTTNKRKSITANTAKWFYNWYNMPKNRYIVGGMFSFKEKKFIKRELTESELMIKEQNLERKKRREERENKALELTKSTKQIKRTNKVNDAVTAPKTVVNKREEFGKVGVKSNGMPIYGWYTVED